MMLFGTPFESPLMGAISTEIDDGNLRVDFSCDARNLPPIRRFAESDVGDNALDWRGCRRQDLQGLFFALDAARMWEPAPARACSKSSSSSASSKVGCLFGSGADHRILLLKRTREPPHRDSMGGSTG